MTPVHVKRLEVMLSQAASVNDTLTKQKLQYENQRNEDIRKWNKQRNIDIENINEKWKQHTASLEVLTTLDLV